MKRTFKALLLVSFLLLCSCNREEYALTLKGVDYETHFYGTTREDVEAFTENSGLMRTPEWPIYAIGYSRYLELCTVEDLYHQTSICNLEQLRGVRGRTLFWQFLTTAKMIVEEDAERFHADMISHLRAWESQARGETTVPEWVEEFKQRSRYIQRIREIRTTKQLIADLKDQMP